MIQNVEKTCSREAARKFDSDESCIRRWRKQKERLLNANTALRAFAGPQVGHFVAVESSICEYVWLLRRQGLPVTRHVLKLKASEIAEEL